ncbi:hypothetical protein [Thermomonospora umbrina]|uniref:hypothetical protein n=1 Tax=Thermomonospora umbrina TaxID=111806 RepID=UPI0011C0EFEA|nr:hypothetical protein [Thermomonospora umbrina]
MTPEDMRMLSRGGRAVSRSVGVTCLHVRHDVGLMFFLVGLFLAGVTSTVTLRWQALVIWPLWGGLQIFTRRRRRDRSPQEAWLQGSVLSVRRGDALRRCDLATARTAALGGNVAMSGERPYYALTVQDGRTGGKVRYVMRTDAGDHLGPGDLRALADAFDSGPQPTEAAQVMAARLREIADHGREIPSSERVDWSHRISH